MFVLHNVPCLLLKGAPLTELLKFQTNSAQRRGSYVRDMQQYPILTSQFSAFGSAFALLQNTVDIVVPQSVAIQDFIHVDAVVSRGVLLVPADPGSPSQGRGCH